MSLLFWLWFEVDYLVNEFQALDGAQFAWFAFVKDLTAKPEVNC